MIDSFLKLGPGPIIIIMLGFLLLAIILTLIVLAIKNNKYQKSEPIEVAEAREEPKKENKYRLFFDKDEIIESVVNVSELIPAQKIIYDKLQQVYCDLSGCSREIKIVGDVQKVPAICWKNTLFVEHTFLFTTANKYENNENFINSREFISDLRDHAKFLIDTRKSILFRME